MDHLGLSPPRGCGDAAAAPAAHPTPSREAQRGFILTETRSPSQSCVTGDSLSSPGTAWVKIPCSGLIFPLQQGRNVPGTWAGGSDHGSVSPRTDKTEYRTVWSLPQRALSRKSLHGLRRGSGTPAAPGGQGSRTSRLAGRPPLSLGTQGLGLPAISPIAAPGPGADKHVCSRAVYGPSLRPGTHLLVDPSELRTASPHEGLRQGRGLWR